MPPGRGEPPSPGIRGISDYTGPIDIHAEYVVVGSGPGGTLLAQALAEAGRDVVVIEAGPRIPPEDFQPDGARTMARHFWDGGMRVMRGNVFMPTLQVRGLGGGTLFNSAICMRATDEALERWVEQHGVEGVSPAELSPWYEEVERFLDIRPTEEAALGRRSTLFREGCEKLGWSVAPLPRMVKGCRGAATCFTGCRSGAKQSLDRRGIPELVENGGRVLTCVQIDRVRMQGSRATGVEGFIIDPASHARRWPVRVRAGTVVLAAGALASPVIARRSGLDSPAIGANLRLHPSNFILARFNEDVLPWKGATQGMHCTRFLDQGIKLEDLWTTPAVLAGRFPALGHRFKEHLSNFGRMGAWAGWVSGEDSVGSLRPGPGGVVDYRFDLHPRDARRLQEATALLCEIAFAAGATEVLHGLSGLPESLHSEDDVRMLRQAEIGPRDLISASNHVFGTMAMGADPQRSATDPEGRVHGTEGLYVCDTGLFPDSPGVNPMHTAMALARRMGSQFASRA